jgi:hypothetical protein
MEYMLCKKRRERERELKKRELKKMSENNVEQRKEVEHQR